MKIKGGVCAYQFHSAAPQPTFESRGAMEFVDVFGIFPQAFSGK